MPCVIIRLFINKCGVWLGGESVTDGSVLSLSRDEDEELDVDMVHTALQEIQQELRDAQRHRVYLILLTEYRFADTNLKLNAIVHLNLVLLFRKPDQSFQQS